MQLLLALTLALTGLLFPGSGGATAPAAATAPARVVHAVHPALVTVRSGTSARGDSAVRTSAGASAHSGGRLTVARQGDQQRSSHTELPTADVASVDLAARPTRAGPAVDVRPERPPFARPATATSRAPPATS